MSAIGFKKRKREYGPMLNHYAMESYRGSGGKAPVILNLSINFTLRPLYSQENELSVSMRSEGKWTPKPVWM